MQKYFTILVCLIILPITYGEELTVFSAPKRQIITDTSNIIMPGDSLFITALGPSRVTASIHVAENGNTPIPFLKSNRLILGYLTIPEAIAQIRGLLEEETEKEFVVNVRKLHRNHE